MYLNTFNRLKANKDINSIAELKGNREVTKHSENVTLPQDSCKGSFIGFFLKLIAPKSIVNPDFLKF